LLLQQVEQHPDVADDPKKPHPIWHGSGLDSLAAVGFLVVSELMVTSEVSILRAMVCSFFFGSDCFQIYV
jgi:hypothetical protein